MERNLVFAEERGGVCAAVVMPWQRRGDFQKLWAGLAARDDAPRSVSWKRLRKRSRGFYEALVDELGQRRWLRVMTSSAGLDDVIRPVAVRGRLDLRVANETLVRTGPGIAARVVEKKAPALRLARLLAQVFALDENAASGSQRRFARAVKERWSEPAAV